MHRSKRVGGGVGPCRLRRGDFGDGREGRGDGCACLLCRGDFGDGRARYEISSNEHHDHLIDIEDGKVIEFVDDQIEKLQHDVAKKLGYDLTGHRMELYGKKIKKN